MSWLKKKEDIQILNTGERFPEPTFEQELRFLSESERFTEITVKEQARRTGNIIYGGQAVNAIVGDDFSRSTHDYDIYSMTPKQHAIDLEQAIDNHTQSDMAHVEEIPFTNEKGESGKMYRVGLKSYDPLADFNRMPKGVKSVVVDGVNYESLDRAEKKYVKMLGEDLPSRHINASLDIDRISLFKYWNRKFW